MKHQLESSLGTPDQQLGQPSKHTLLALIKSDAAANQRNPKGFILAFLYRSAHVCADLPTMLRPLGYVWIAIYKLITEYILGSEIHWRAAIGPGLCIYHGYGLVVNSATRIGANCTLRHGVTIGVKETDGKLGSPLIGARVDIGAGAIVLGPIEIGDDCVLGAGTVVVKSIPQRAVVVGNPGRIIRIKKNESGYVDENDPASHKR